MHCFKPCLIWTMLQMNTSCIVVLKNVFWSREHFKRPHIVLDIYNVFGILDRLNVFFVQINCFTCLKYRQQSSTARKDNSYWHFLIQCIPLIICSQTKIILNKKMKIVTEVEIFWHIFWLIAIWLMFFKTSNACCYQKSKTIYVQYEHYVGANRR